jgi:hypothetical protein
MLIILLLLFATQTLGWSCHGHMIVYQQALLQLNQTQINTLNKILAPLQPYDFGSQLEQACWADDIKLAGWSATSPWHYADYPYFVNISENNCHLEKAYSDVISTIVSVILEKRYDCFEVRTHKSAADEHFA